MLPFNSGVLTTEDFVAEITRCLKNNTQGLRNVLNNRGITSNGKVRWSLGGQGMLAKPVNSGAPMTYSQSNFQNSEAAMEFFETSVLMDEFLINSNVKPSEILSVVSQQVSESIENTYTDKILTELSNYDDVNMEIGDNTTFATVDMLRDLETKARMANWGDTNSYLLVSPYFMNALKKDPDFKSLINIADGQQVFNADTTRPDQAPGLRWVKYGMFYIAEMGMKGIVGSTNNPTGLSLAGDGSQLCYAFKGDRVGFAQNATSEFDIYREKSLSGHPYVSYAKNNCAVKIIDPSAVIGVKIKNQMPA